MITMPNKPNASDAAMALRFQFASIWGGVGDLGRSL
jgi:hypothetical protein